MARALIGGFFEVALALTSPGFTAPLEAAFRPQQLSDRRRNMCGFAPLSRSLRRGAAPNEVPKLVKYLEAVKPRLAGDTVCAANSGDVKGLRQDAAAPK